MVTASSYVDWSSMWKILAISIGVGAGLVLVFSVGLVALSSSGYFVDTDEGAVAHRNVAALAVAVICAVIVILGVVYGVHTIFEKG